MRFSIQLPCDRVECGDEFVAAESIAALARGAEGAGFDACWVSEHPIPPDDWLASGGHHGLDPFVALTAAALATHRLRLHTNVLVLPYRSPFLTAKSAASLDRLSGGRLILGVAAGYLEGEYAALGADFENRNALCDEALAVLEQVWRGLSVAMSGRGFEARGNTALPRPVQDPHPPVWVGGNSTIALRRAALRGQGWSPFPVPARFAGRTRTAAIETVGDLAARIRRLRELADAAGRRESLDVNFVPFGHGMGSRRRIEPAPFREQVEELESIGVTWLSLGLPGASRAACLDELARIGAEVIAPLRGRDGAQASGGTADAGDRAPPQS